MPSDIVSVIVGDHVLLRALAGRLAGPLAHAIQRTLLAEFSKVLAAHLICCDRYVFAALASNQIGVTASLTQGHEELQSALAELLTRFASSSHEGIEALPPL